MLSLLLAQLCFPDPAGVGAGNRGKKNFCSHNCASPTVPGGRIHDGPVRFCSHNCASPTRVEAGKPSVSRPHFCSHNCASPTHFSATGKSVSGRPRGRFGRRGAAPRVASGPRSRGPVGRGLPIADFRRWEGGAQIKKAFQRTPSERPADPLGPAGRTREGRFGARGCTGLACRIPPHSCFRRFTATGAPARTRPACRKHLPCPRQAVREAQSLPGHRQGRALMDGQIAEGGVLHGGNLRRMPLPDLPDLDPQAFGGPMEKRDHRPNGPTPNEPPGVPMAPAPDEVALPLEKARVEDKRHAMMGGKSDNPNGRRFQELPHPGLGDDGPLPSADPLVLPPLEAFPVQPGQRPPVARR